MTDNKVHSLHPEQATGQVEFESFAPDAVQQVGSDTGVAQLVASVVVGQLENCIAGEIQEIPKIKIHINGLRQCLIIGKDF